MLQQGGEVSVTVHLPDRGPGEEGGALDQHAVVVEEHVDSGDSLLPAIRGDLCDNHITVGDVHEVDPFGVGDHFDGGVLALVKGAGLHVLQGREDDFGEGSSAELVSLGFFIYLYLHWIFVGVLHHCLQKVRWVGLVIHLSRC